MKNINIIVATSTEYGLGFNNKMCWNIPEELQYFRKITIGNKKNCVIMGKNTWYSLPDGPLKNRTNVVISNADYIQTYNDCNNHGVIVKNCIEDAIDFVEQNDNIENVFIIGGSQLYNYCLDKLVHKISKIYLSIIYDKKYTCDTFINSEHIYKNFHFEKENIHFTERYVFMIGNNKNRTILDEPPI